MYKMVSECTVSSEGKSFAKKVMYLTNRQASLFDESAMIRCIDALDLGQPKFVINLLPSSGFTKFHKFNTLNSSSNLCLQDDRYLERQTLLFMKTCILPIANQTQALILVDGATECILSAALAHVALSEQTRLGKECSFTIVATVTDSEVRDVARESSNSIAAQILKNCPAWKKRFKSVGETLSAHNIPCKRCDLNPSATRYIIFEGIDEDEDPESNTKTFSYKPEIRKTFVSTLLQILISKLPSVAIQSNHIDLGISYLSDLASGNMPILLLDSYERAISMRNMANVEVPITFAGVFSYAFPKIPATRLQNICIANDGSISIEGRHELLNIAMEILERKWIYHMLYGIKDIYDCSLYAFIHSALTLGSKSIGTSVTGRLSLFEKIEEMEAFQRANKDIHHVKVPPELASKAIAFIQEKAGSLDPVYLIKRLKKWLMDHPAAYTEEKISNKKRKERKRLRATVMQWIANLENIQAPTKSTEPLSASSMSFYSTKTTNKTLDLHEWQALGTMDWLGMFDMFTRPNVFSGSVHDIIHLKKSMANIAKIDRLPDANSLESLKAIRDAWDHVELYNRVATAYKNIANLCYVLLLCLGILVTIIATLESTELSLFMYSRDTLIAVSFFTTFILGVVKFTNPILRWQQLRIAALTLEGNIFAFRTRTGNYRSKGRSQSTPYGNQIADHEMIKLLHHVKENVLEAADVKGTMFYGKIKSQNLYGQSSPAMQKKHSWWNNFIHGASSYGSSSNRKAAQTTKPDMARRTINTPAPPPSDIELGRRFTSFMMKDEAIPTMNNEENEEEKEDDDDDDDYDDEYDENGLSSSRYTSRTFREVAQERDALEILLTQLETNMVFHEKTDVAELKNGFFLSAKRATGELSPAKKHVPRKYTTDSHVSYSQAYGTKNDLTTLSIPTDSSSNHWNRSDGNSMGIGIGESSDVDDGMNEDEYPRQRMGSADENEEQTNISQVSFSAPLSVFHMSQRKKQSSYFVSTQKSPKLRKGTSPTVISPTTINNTLNNINANISSLSKSSFMMNNSSNMKSLLPKNSILSFFAPHTQPQEEYELEEVVQLLRRSHASSLATANGLAIIPPDNHYDPITPDLYIRYRIQPMILFFQARVPLLFTARAFCQIVIIAGSVLIGAFSFYNLIQYTAIVTVVTSAVAAYLEYNGIESKINRYSNVIHALQELIMWWETLSPIDHSAVENIDRLVFSAEELLLRERQAWKATSQAAKLLQKAAHSLQQNAPSDGENSSSKSSYGLGDV